MGLFELLILAVSLAMDAFAVAVCKGLAMRRFQPGAAAKVGLYFGGFQFLMPMLGWLLASTFADKITAFDHWIAFLLLIVIGGNMIKEGFEKDEKPVAASVTFRVMLPMAIATSIDAMAVGITFAFLDIRSPLTALLYAGVIGVITFIISVTGVRVGSIFGSKYKTGAEICGGVVLILLGVKILLEHLGLLPF